MMTCCVLLSAVGSIICLSNGGYVAFKAWLGTSTEQCSVTDLSQLHKAGVSKFFCQDGFMDEARQATLLMRDDSFRGGMKTFRMAPIYMDSTLGSPVAWGISRDHHLAVSPCSGSGVGLCGVMLPPLTSAEIVCSTPVLCLTMREKGFFVKLQDTVTKEIQEDQPDQDWDIGNLPLVLLTDPRDPEGSRKHLLRAIGCWAFTLLGFLCVLGDLAMEECSKSRASYEPLTANGHSATHNTDEDGSRFSVHSGGSSSVASSS